MEERRKDLADQTEPQGVRVIKDMLRNIPECPGVYRMLGAKGDVLYVGKALNLKKRVTSYTRLHRLEERIRLMVSLTSGMEIVVTHTEAEALLLEANYIKRMKPRFNILLRDDKSYPWLVLTGGHAFPRLMRQRGKPLKGATYWGPFASSWAVDQTIHVIQRSFLLRTCTDSVFSSRSRPCLLYQIKRCSAPCVERVTQKAYAHLVQQTKDFLSGGGRELQQQLTQEMEKASEAMAYEQAALIRDRIRAFTNLRSSSTINPTTIDEADVVALWNDAGQTCLQVFFIRGGRNNGNRAFFPAHDQNETVEAVLEAFLLQFYDDKQPPAHIITNINLTEHTLLEEALALKKGRRVEILFPQRGEKKHVLEHAVLNAREALERKLAENVGQQRLLEGVAKCFHLPAPPKRIEVYDNSHLMGQAPYGVMIVGGEEGFIKRAYRKYAIRGPVTPGDDFAMMREVMTRRFASALSQECTDSPREHWPDLLLIDGGKGQVHAVQDILNNIGVTHIPIVGMAKGIDRNAGREWFVLPDREPFQLPERDPVLYYLQRLRDEAHRFAITTHRKGRSKALTRSRLDDVPGIGAVRKKALLTRFGSVRQIQQASIAELSCVPGIHRELAEGIYGHFHPEWVRKESAVVDPCKRDEA